ncbi:MAG TPA: glycosyltransferase [Sulfuricurvum sp.]|nr:MAG: hypothetical protein B7Y30_01975 [Campylobacterales bacterium 16-40-21]OZA02869.1 MAG: hypothetical protein B7X89_07270 [Sulfuricurvum sp. 17-40-25]HQS67173.1 glycosyltransferase [Sulfuricurvum sp.]HQT36898.1 glycosyltransferase [Sulfuricurvum sp.]
MIKTSACVVLYNPTIEVIENVATYANKVDDFIVIDNSDIQQHDIIKNLKITYPKLIYINNHANLGIATALNITCDTAIAQNSNWILTMDQDSKFVNFQDYLNCLHSLDDTSEIALLAPNTGRYRPEDIETNSHDCTFEEQFIVITSGNFLNLNLFNSIGRFDENLFIDVVDYDYCAKVRLAGYKTLLFKNILLEHQLGILHKRENLLTRKIKYKIEHSPQRAYYIARNYLYLALKYRQSLPQEFALLKVLNIIFIHDVTKILLYEDQKWNKISAKFLGAYHFMIGKYGKYTL